MKKQIKIIYEDFTETKGRIKQSLKTALVPFSDRNTTYLEGDGYTENFERFLQDVFECGHVFLSSTEAVSILQIKKYEAYNPVEVKPKKVDQGTNKQNSNKKKPNKKNVRGNQKSKQANKKPVKTPAESNQPKAEPFRETDEPIFSKEEIKELEKDVQPKEIKRVKAKGENPVVVKKKV